MISAKIIEDSISPDGVRLSTIEACIARSTLAELNTHRDFSRNSASSRAIPVEKQLERVKNDPFIPLHWGKNQPGMSADEELEGEEREEAITEWLTARDRAVESADELMKLDVHKQVTNRILEPFMWHTVIITATQWNNFFALRRSSKAQPEIHAAADAIWDAMKASTPKYVDFGEWHLPYIQDDEREVLDLGDLVQISSARCARVSYLTHAGVRSIDKDLELYQDLVTPGHMSPMEHPATPVEHHPNSFYGNFKGWKQHRKFLPYEADFSERPQVVNAT